MEKIKIFACPTAEKFTKEICDCLGIKLGQINHMKFKNDNNFVQIQESVREKDIYIVQTTEPPVNERIMELLITIDAVKRASAKNINVVLPYFPYSRSDKKDQPRVPITAKLMAEIIEAAGATRVITCDLHNPAIQAYFNINCYRLTGEYLLEEYFRQKKLDNMVIVATDAGSSKKAYKYSEYFECPIALVDKRREGNDDRAIASTIIGNVKDKNAIIFDDEIDTAGSMMETVKVLKKFGAKAIYAGCTHAVLSGPAIERIQNSEIKELVVTNTIPLTKENAKQQEKMDPETAHTKFWQIDDPLTSRSGNFIEPSKQFHNITNIDDLNLLDHEFDPNDPSLNGASVIVNQAQAPVLTMTEELPDFNVTHFTPSKELPVEVSPNDLVPQNTNYEVISHHKDAMMYLLTLPTDKGES